MLQAERGASRNTLVAYGADLADLQTFLARRKQGPVAADAAALRAYLKSLDYLGMTPRTVARRLSVIRQF
ncbi:MAG: site-specific integrase, partial [Rhodospirillales bacterium]|nr:site-specific integrase [Rhodospirillales bacterium]